MSSHEGGESKSQFGGGLQELGFNQTPCGSQATDSRFTKFKPSQFFPIGAPGQGGGSDQGLQPRDGSKRGTDGEIQDNCDELSQGGDRQAGGGRGKAQRGVGQEDERAD